MRIGAFLQQNLDPVAADWMELAHRRPDQHHLSQSIPLDRQRELLTGLAARLEAEADTRFVPFAENPALMPWGHDVPLASVIAEYGILRRVIVTRYFEDHGDIKNVVQLDGAIDIVIGEAIDSYTDARDARVLEVAMRARVAAAAAGSQELSVAILGHDLRNPLNAILMGARLLETSSRLDEEDRRILARLTGSAGRMSRMIRDVVDLAAARQGGGLIVHPLHDDLGSITRQAVDEIALAHPRRAIALELDGDLRGRFDRDRMLQALSNLIGNAVAHGQDPIEVSAVSDATHVRVSVSNAGKPIDPDLVPHLFEPFRRGHERRSDGIGLGLYITAQVVSAHGGSLEVRSGPIATVFSVALPRALADA